MALSILWVDDEEETLVGEIDELEDLGHEVLVEGNLDKAIETLKHRKFDLILIDQQLYGEDLPNSLKINLWMGCIFLRAIRNNFDTIQIAPEWVQEKLASLARDKTLRNHENESVYVAFFSAFSSEEVKAEIRASSTMDDETRVWAKPIDSQTLLRVVDTATKRKET